MILFGYSVKNNTKISETEIWARNTPKGEITYDFVLLELPEIFDAPSKGDAARVLFIIERLHSGEIDAESAQETNLKRV